MIELAGYVAVDESDFCVWGTGKSEAEAEKDAWNWLASTRPKYGAALGYYECTQAVLDYVKKNGGGDDVPLKHVLHERRYCMALEDEIVNTRCPHTKDLFKNADGAKTEA